MSDIKKIIEHITALTDERIHQYDEVEEMALPTPLYGSDLKDLATEVDRLTALLGATDILIQHEASNLREQMAGKVRDFKGKREAVRNARLQEEV